MHEIVPGRLYQRGEFSGFTLEEKLHALHSRGITAVANLVRNSDPDIAANFYYLHYPIPDNQVSAEEARVLVEVASIFSGLMEQGDAVLVHCHAGRNRSGLLSALICREYLGLSGTQAIEYVRQKRPNALANEHFVRFLETRGD